MPALKANLSLIKCSFDEGKVPSPLNLASLRDMCHGNALAASFDKLKGKDGCVEFQRSERPYAVISLSKRALGCPLIVVNEGTGTLTRSIEQAFAVGELSKQDLGTPYFADFRQ
jgi:hypothetical protein